MTSTSEILSSLGVFAAHGEHVVRSPIDGAQIGRLQLDDAKALGEKVAASAVAFQYWRTVPAPRRGELVRLFGEDLVLFKDEQGRYGSIGRNCPHRGTDLASGLDGVGRKLDPGPSADMPYETKAAALPKSLHEAASVLRADGTLRSGFGGAFVDYYAHIKEAEFARFAKGADAETADVTPWEQNEYFDLF